MKGFAIRLAVLFVAGAVLTLVFLAATRIAIANYAAYGKVATGGSAVLHLPAGTVDAGFAEQRVQFQGAVADIVVPGDLTLAADPVQGSGPRPSIRRDESTDGPNDYSDGPVNVETRVWKVDVRQAGQYRVTSGGHYEFPSELVFGGSATLSAGLVWAVAGIVMLVLAIVWSLVATRERPVVSPSG
jgi:hypothetical protein